MHRKIYILKAHETFMEKGRIAIGIFVVLVVAAILLLVLLPVNFVGNWGFADLFKSNPQIALSPSTNNLSQTGLGHAKDVLLVKFKPGVSEGERKGVYKKLGIEENRTIGYIKVLKVPEKALDNVKGALSHNSRVEFVEYDSFVQPIAGLGLVADYSFDSDVNDASGNNLNGVNYGGTFSAGKDGNALNLNGSGYVSVDDNSLLDNTNKLTIVAWVYPALLDGNARAVVSKRVDSNNQQAYTIFFYTGNKLAVDIDGYNNRIFTNKVFSPNNWYHVAVVYDGSLASSSRVKVYVDGALDVQGAETSSIIPDYNSNLTIGMMQKGYAYGFKGMIDELQIYNLALSAQEISNLYSGSAGLNCNDSDGDGYFSQAVCGTLIDCNDNNTGVHPGAAEISCNAIDENCDGVDFCCADSDKDGYFSQAGCGSLVDCNDNNAGINPNASEIQCNSIDENCDGKDLCASMPNDPKISSEYHVTLMHYPQAWNISTGSAEVIVANPDTGITSSNEDLKNILLMNLAYNTADGTNNTSPVMNHGTGTAGCIGAQTNNSIGIASAGWKTKIIPIRVTNAADGYAYLSDMAQGVVYAADHGAKVVSVSYTGAGSSTMASAGDYIRNKGGLLFMGSGNDGTNQSFTNYPGIIAVAATTSGDSRASFSNYGDFVDIAAPGYGVYTTSGNSYGSMSGTSFSSPLAASVAAYLFSAYPSATNTQIEQAMFNGAKDLGAAGKDVYFGYGRVDAYGAVQQMGMPYSDKIAPSVSITSPSSNQNVQGGIDVNVQASDNIAIGKVELYVDNGLYATATSGVKNIYSFYWDLDNVSDGSHKLIAKAYDTSLNTNNNSISVNVSRDLSYPTISIASPPNKTTIRKGAKAFTVTTSTSANTGEVDFYVNNQYLGSDLTSPFTYSIQTAPYLHQTIVVRADAINLNNGLTAGSYVSIIIP